MNVSSHRPSLVPTSNRLELSNEFRSTQRGERAGAARHPLSLSRCLAVSLSTRSPRFGCDCRCKGSMYVHVCTDGIHVSTFDAYY